MRFSPDGFHGTYTNYAADIAVVEVSPAFQFDSQISTVCLDTNVEKYSDELEKSGLVKKKSLYYNLRRFPQHTINFI